MKQFVRPFFCFFIIIFCSSYLNAQEVWDWQKCIDYATENNIQIQQSNINVSLGETTLKSNKMNYSPSINARSNYNVSIGNSFNYFTTNYEQQIVHYQDYALNVSQPIFDGLYTPNSVKKSKLDLQALKLDQETLKNNVILQLLTAFLNIMNANEQHQQALNQYSITKEQYERTQALIKEGAAAENALLDIDAQLANEELSIEQIKNQLDLSYLNLKLLLQLEPNKNITIKIPELPTDFAITTLDDVQSIYNSALQLRPEIKSIGLKAESAKKQIAIAKSGYYPTLNFVGNINTFFTNQNKITNTITTGTFIPSGAFVDGTFQQVLIPETITEIKKNPYGNQLRRNLSYAFGLSLNIPIFDKFQTQTAVKQSKLQYQNALLNQKQTALDLFNSVQQAYLKAQAAINNYNAAKKNYETSKKSYEYAKERLDLGSIGQLELNVAKTSLDNAISKLTQAKYEYLFNSKLLDFYQGKKIEL
ncbi:MAG: TolC family protein [Bacteroidetes bacterium]|nr:TolC family protein [Bacteroidota bacterium]